MLQVNGPILLSLKLVTVFFTQNKRSQSEPPNFAIAVTKVKNFKARRLKVLVTMKNTTIVINVYKTKMTLIYVATYLVSSIRLSSLKKNKNKNSDGLKIKFLISDFSISKYIVGRVGHQR